MASREGLIQSLSPHGVGDVLADRGTALPLVPVTEQPAAAPSASRRFPPETRTVGAGVKLVSKNDEVGDSCGAQLS